MKLPPVLDRHVREHAERLGITPEELVIQATIKSVGLDGFPLDDETVWAVPEDQKQKESK